MFTVQRAIKSISLYRLHNKTVIVLLCLYSSLLFTHFTSWRARNFNTALPSTISPSRFNVFIYVHLESGVCFLIFLFQTCPFKSSIIVFCVLEDFFLKYALLNKKKYGFIMLSLRICYFAKKKSCSFAAITELFEPIQSGCFCFGVPNAIYLCPRLLLHGGASQG